MREIKSRGYRIDGQGWVYGSLVIADNVPMPNGDGRVKNVTCYFIHERDCRVHHVHESSVGQYTGIKDSKDVEIFEGDILESFHFIDYRKQVHHLRHSVEWSDKHSGWFCNSGYDTGNTQLWVYVKSAKDLKVVGNVYENHS